jgi:hypothetical protein
MNGQRRLAAGALLALPLFQGCWPMAPIAALAAGGGGGGGSAAAVALSGSIITDATAFGGGLRLDREPNDSAGFAPLLAAPANGAAARGIGDCGAALALHALVETDEGAFVVGRQLLSDDVRRHPLRGASPRALARLGQELLLIADDGAGRATMAATPLVSGLVKRRLELALPVAVGGAAACLDALLVLDTSGIDARLVAFDADDGDALAVHDLRRSGLSHLAGGVELETGAQRLFTCDADAGVIHEVALEDRSGEIRFGALRALDVPAAPIDALAFDGMLLHVLRRDGRLEAFRRDGTRVAESAWPESAGATRSLVAQLDLGVDGWQVEIPAGGGLSVSIAARSGAESPASLFLAAQPRSAMAAPDDAPATQVSRFRAEGDAVELRLPGDATRPLLYDVWVGSLAGAARYEFAIGAAARAPRAAPPAGPPADPDLVAAVSDRLMMLTDERLSALHSDPLLPDFVPGRLVLGRKVAAAHLSLPPAAAGLAFASEERSISGFDRVRVTTTPSWRGAAPRTLNGVSSRRANRREESRVLVAALCGLRGAAGVEWSEPDYLARSLATPNDPGFATNQQWHYDLLNLPAAWDLSIGAATTVLAVVDTGVRTDNVDLTANVGPDGYDFVSSTSNSGDGNGRDPDPFDQGSFAGNGHHGSHCGGTMGARGNNGTQGTGICWNVELMMLRALGTDGIGSTTDIAEAIRYAAGLANASGQLPATAAAAINLSLGTFSISNAIQGAVNAAINAGSIVCAAAGNDGNGQAVLFPAAHDPVIAIAAADFAGDLAFYSNTGPEIDVTCSGGSADGNPAHDVASTVGVGPNGSLQTLAGTSMACAHATGIVGLLVTQSPGLLQSEVETLLRDAAVDAGAPGFDEGFGHGILDAAAAVSDVTADAALPTGEIDFGSTGTRLVMQVTNAGGGSLDLQGITITSVQEPPSQAPDASWLAVAIRADETTLDLTADRALLAAGAWQAQVDILSNGGTESLLVNVTAGGAPLTDVGDVTIQLFEDDGTTLAHTFVATFADGYAWELRGVRRGSYFLRAGVDVDLDGTLGEIGEPFGAWPNVADQALLDYLGQPLALDLLIE